MCGIRNGRERERDGDGGETSVRYQKWKRERERWRRERRHEEEATHGRWTVVHSLAYIVVTFPTSHAERSPLN